MNSSASAGFDAQGNAQQRRCGSVFKARWSPWEVGAMVAGFVVFWPLGLVALFLKWKNGEMWPGSSASMPWSGFKSPDFSKWKSEWSQRGPSSFGFTGSGNAAFDAYREEQLRRLDEERRKLEEEQKLFRDFVEKVRRAKDQDEFDRFMAERRSTPPAESNG
jgi:hypothetical protein